MDSLKKPQEFTRIIVGLAGKKEKLQGGEWKGDFRTLGGVENQSRRGIGGKHKELQNRIQPRRVHITLKFSLNSLQRPNLDRQNIPPKFPQYRQYPSKHQYPLHAY